MPLAHIRFYANLNDFLSLERRQTRFAHAFEGRVSVKDMIESLGVPHTEVDLILVNDEPVGFGHLVASGDTVSVYPQFRTLDIKTVTQVRPEPPTEARFVLDVHLGRLASYLRTMGFDALYPENYDDHYLAELASRENRIMLTRDRGLLKRSVVTYGYCVRETNPRAQVIEILRRFNLASQIQPFKRCARCNGMLVAVPKETIADRLKPETRRYFEDFRICQSCEQIYWQGSHYERMQQFINDVLAQVNNNQSHTIQKGEDIP